MKKFLTVMLLIGALMLSGCETTVASGEGGGADTTTDTQSLINSEEEVLFENEIVKVAFVEIFEAPGVVGTCYLRLKVENKSDKTVTVYLKDTYVNDSAQLIGSGVPMVLAPGKNSQSPFFFGYTNLDISGKDDVKKIEFKVFLLDGDSNTVLETESLSVEFSN